MTADTFCVEWRNSTPHFELPFTPDNFFPLEELNYFQFLALVTRPTAALNSATQHRIQLETIKKSLHSPKIKQTSSTTNRITYIILATSVPRTISLFS